MLRTIVMAAIGKVKPPTLEVPPTTYGSVGTKTQIRSFQTNSSPVYKTQSDSSIINGMKGLNLSNKQNRNVPKARRSIYGGSGERIIKSLNDLAQSIKEDVYKNVVVVAGAGISTPSGIPDFRSPGTGLYDNLQQYRIPYPEAIFDIDYFHQNPRPFFTLAKELYPTGKYRPNYIHYFVRLLHDKGLLLRMYTQNIDGLERLAGLPEEKLVEAHGTFSSATCVICKHKHETTEVRDYIFKDKIPICKKRGCPGIVKPDIVFFGEDLPRRFYYYLKDMINTDLVIIMGTSLEVQPFAGIVDTVKWNIPRVLFNMHAVGPFRYQRRSQDVVAEGDMIESLEKFTDNLNWKNEMVELITNSEGSYKVRTVAASPYKPPPPPKGGPIQNAFMRESARLNLYTGSDSSESETEESSTETETSSSDDDETPRARSSPYKRGTINRTRGGKTNGALTRNGYDNSKSGKRNGVLEPTNGNKNKRNYSTTTTTERPRGTPVSVRSVNSDKSAKTGRSKSVEQNSKDHSNNNRTKSGEMNSKGDKSKYRARSVDGSAKGDNQSTSRSDISDLQNVRRNKTPTNKTMLSGKNDSPTKTKGMKKALSERSLESKVTTKALEGRLKRTSSAKNVPNSKENETEKSEEKQETTLVNDENNPLPKRDKPPVAATKPPLPKPTVPKELQALNTRPYGYLANRRLTGRPTINKNNVIADKTTNKFIRDMLSQRASSAEVPKIAYRHRLQTRQFYDARILSYNGSENQESSGEEESSSDSC